MYHHHKHRYHGPCIIITRHSIFGPKTHHAHGRTNATAISDVAEMRLFHGILPCMPPESDEPDVFLHDAFLQCVLQDELC